jgi:hypothetical protein
MIREACSPPRHQRSLNALGNVFLSEAACME